MKPMIFPEEEVNPDPTSGDGEIFSAQPDGTYAYTKYTPSSKIKAEQS